MLTWSLHFIDLETYGAESLRCLCEWFCLWFQPDVVWFCVVPQDDSDAWKFRSTCASAGSDEIGETDNIVWYNLYIQLTDEKPPFWNEATAACLVDPKIERNYPRLLFVGNTQQSFRNAFDLRKLYLCAALHVALIWWIVTCCSRLDSPQWRTIDELGLPFEVIRLSAEIADVRKQLLTLGWSQKLKLKHWRQIDTNDKFYPLAKFAAGGTYSYLLNWFLNLISE